MFISHLRNIAASALTISGVNHIALLWVRDINLPLLASVLFGAVYLFIGIALYGQSRFSLFTAMVIPAMGATWALTHAPLASFSTLGLGLLGMDFIVIVFSAVVLFAERNKPSV